LTLTGASHCRVDGTDHVLIFRIIFNNHCFDAKFKSY
jgi:hypothetical protein